MLDMSTHRKRKQNIWQVNQVNSQRLVHDLHLMQVTIGLNAWFELSSSKIQGQQKQQGQSYYSITQQQEPVERIIIRRRRSQIWVSKRCHWQMLINENVNCMWQFHVEILPFFFQCWCHWMCFLLFFFLIFHLNRWYTVTQANLRSKSKWMIEVSEEKEKNKRRTKKNEIFFLFFFSVFRSCCYL